VLPFFIKGSKRRSYSDTQLFTSSAVEQDLPFNIRLSQSGANPRLYIIARRDTESMAGFGWSGTVYKLGGVTDWGGVWTRSVTGDITLNTGYPAVAVGEDSPWNDVGHDGDGNVIFGVGPAKAELLTWTGDGTSGQTVNHNLGVRHGAAFITSTDVSFRENYIYHNQRPTYLWKTDAGWYEDGENVMGTGTSSVTVRGSLNTSGVSYSGVIITGHGTIPGDENHIDCGLTAGVSTSIGWQPRVILWIDTAGNLRWWIQKRDEGQGDVSSDLSTQLSDTSGVNVNSLVTPTTDGFEGNVGYYMAFR
jgi:hypothetical protein